MRDACILNGYVEADHDRVGFDEYITCAGGDTPIECITIIHVIKKCSNKYIP